MFRYSSLLNKKNILIDFFSHRKQKTSSGILNNEAVGICSFSVEIIIRTLVYRFKLPGKYWKNLIT